MSFLNTVPEETAEGAVAAMYAGLIDALGYLPNYGRQFSHRPAVFDAWTQLNTTIKSTMDPRRYELATVAAAVHRQSSYCSLAHGEKLLRLGSTSDQVAALVRGQDDAGLTELERAIVEYATKVASDPASTTQSDVDRLNHLGLSDDEIFDVAAAAAARCFFTALGDSVGTIPDRRFRETIPDLVEVLSVGRPIPE